MFTPELTALAQRIGVLLKQRNETVAVAEGSAGGLISASLLSIAGASAYYLGGTVIYTFHANKALFEGAIETPERMRGATEVFAQYLAKSASVKIGSTWGIGEAGAAGPPNRYGDPAGHAWVAVAGPRDATRHLLTGVEDRVENMVIFAVGALMLLAETLEALGDAPAGA
jgi:nicotinamide-nucleotide amidase